MTDLLHLPARPGAPVACDMSTAPDTPEERVAEYRELFARALLRRERGERRVVFVLAAGARPQVDDLARREAACCPFLDYRVESSGDEVRFTITGADDMTLDAFSALPEHARSETMR